jgi:hypothetical protein
MKIKHQADSTGPDYEWKIQWIENKRVGIVIDLNLGGRSVTNSILTIAKELVVDNIIYRDSEGNWDFWSKRLGFRPLGGVEDAKLVSCRTLPEAIETAKLRYLTSETKGIKG